MADNMSKLSIDPNLVGFGFYCKSLSSNLEKWQPILWFWLMADIQDGRQHVKVVDWPKLSGVRFLLQVPIINFREMAADFVILGNGWHPRWLTMAYVIETCAKYPLQQNWKKKMFRVSEVRFNLPRFNPRLKHLCVTFMHFKKVTKKISQNRLKISCVKSSENCLGNSSSHQLFTK